MGQYHIVVNLDKRQYLHAHSMDSGLKLMEWNAGPVTMALSLLLSTSNGLGGGDFRLGPKGDPRNLIGSWAGDRIVVAGDYMEPGRFISDSDLEIWLDSADPNDEYSQNPNLYSIAKRFYEEIGGYMYGLLVDAKEV